MEDYIILVVLVLLYLIIKRGSNSPSKIPDVEEFFKYIEIKKKNYISYYDYEQILHKFRSMYNFFVKNNVSCGETEENFLNIYSSLKKYVRKWNSEFIKRELLNTASFFDDIDGKKLDLNQRIAVITDEVANLVVAGAGSGKTLTILAKVKYLIKYKNIKPDEILLISFTNKVTDELSEKLNKLGVEIQATNFHKLGKSIIIESTGESMDVLDESVSEGYRVIKKFFDNLLFEDKLKEDLIKLNFLYLNLPYDMEDFDNYNSQIKGYNLESLKSLCDAQIKKQKAELSSIKGEKMRSLEEVMVANFLYLNSIEYEYEKKYPFDTNNKYFKTYRPDFYLPEYNIYLEHFGINESNRAPWLSKVEEKKYLAGIFWKRNIHNENGTNLIETYSWQVKNGILFEHLSDILKANGVAFKSPDYQEIYKCIMNNKNNNVINEFIKTVKNFIDLYKSQYGSENVFIDLKERVLKNQNNFEQQREVLYLNIIKAVYDYYQNYLQKEEKIDFNDMLNFASDRVQKNGIKFGYKYIIIDEYQDTSFSKYNLIRSIYKNDNSKIMCVGDDWQSIYRFSGSDIDLFSNFKKYFEHYELLKIEKTFRNSQELLNLAGNFVMQNPNQLRKDLVSDKMLDRPVVIISHGSDKDSYSALNLAIKNIVNQSGENSKILLLGRTKYDIETYVQNDKFSIDISKGGKTVVKSKDFPSVDIVFMTVHKSKGLESDNVIVLNVANKLLGFPNKISDDRILSYVLSSSDNFIFGEERRLFYVALTRTKNKVYLLVPALSPSIFIKELNKNEYYGNFIQNLAVQEKQLVMCPRCFDGHLLIRKWEGKDFISCSNYPRCDFKISKSQLKGKCPKCGGFLVERISEMGEFDGCTNYPFCDYKYDPKRKKSNKFMDF